MMKTKIFFSLFVILALFACSNDDIQDNNSSDAKQPTITFDLTPVHPDESASEMCYDGSKWTTIQMNGTTEESLGLSNGATGTMRAVYLPFGCNATVSESGTSFVFNKTYYTYYLTATLDYTVVDNRLPTRQLPTICWAMPIVVVSCSVANWLAAMAATIILR